MLIIFFIFAPFTNLNFIFMSDLQKTINYSLVFLTALEKVLVHDMSSVESEIEHDVTLDSALLPDYNTCGFILAAIRDIKKELGLDGK